MRPRRALQSIAFAAFAPLVILQGLWVKLRARRAPAAAGPRSGSVGTGEPLKLLLVGDSIVAGVGVDRLDDALPGRLAAALADATGRRVAWSALGVSGFDARRVRRLVERGLAPADDADCLFVSVGVNDVTGLKTARHWRRELRALLLTLRERCPRAMIVLSGLPPLHGFPALPQPLRALLGMRARGFDAIAEDVAGAADGVVFSPNRFEPDPAGFAEDGYHPSAASCAAWAGTLSATIAPLLLRRIDPPRA